MFDLAKVSLVSVLTLGAIAPAATADLRFTRDLPGAFLDIQGVGQRFDLGDDAAVSVTTTVGNALLPAGSIRISNNGAVGWGNAGGTSFSNAAIPSPGLAGGGQALAVFWDDLVTFTAAEGVYVAEIDGTLYVTWRLGHLNKPDSPGTVQLQVFSSGPVFAQFIYQNVDFGGADVNGGASATIGYQAGGVGVDLPFSFNSAGAVANGTVLTLYDPSSIPVTIVDNIPGTYVDITSVGTPFNLMDDSQVDTNVTVGNALLPPGVIRISNNGAVGWNNTRDISYRNEQLPSQELAEGSQALAVFWDDLLTYNRPANQFADRVYVAQVGGTLCITWRLGSFLVTGTPGIVQLQVFSSGPVFAQFIYVDVDFGGSEADLGASATIGYQSGGSGGVAVWSVDQGGSVFPGKVLSLVRGTGDPFCGRDFNRDGTVNADDLSDFITRYFSGCN